MSIYVYQQLHAVAKRHETSLLLRISRSQDVQAGKINDEIMAENILT